MLMVKSRETLATWIVAKDAEFLDVSSRKTTAYVTLALE
jgi:hypothetical protein